MADKITKINANVIEVQKTTTERFEKALLLKRRNFLQGEIDKIDALLAGFK